MLRPGDALVIVDAEGDAAIADARDRALTERLNAYLRHFARRRLPVFVTRRTAGTTVVPGLQLPAGTTIMACGTGGPLGQALAADGIAWEERVRAAGIRRLFVGGFATAFHALRELCATPEGDWQIHLLRDAVRATSCAADGMAREEKEARALGAASLTLAELAPTLPEFGALLTDWYQLTMLRGYFANRMEETAVFEFFVRRLPPRWNFLVAGGLEQVLDYLTDFRFSAAELEWLEAVGGFQPEVVKQLGELRFTGDVHAMAEGTIFFPDEPILRVTAPMAEAQVVETRLVNLLHFPTLVASKAVRSVIAAPAKTLVDFGLRRAHGAEAGLLAARACYLAGFAATSNAGAVQRFGLPPAGTMAHSFVEACATEEEAFLRFARANPDNAVLLLDTYDTEAAARTVVALAPQLRAEGIAIRGVRIDSGDLAAQARCVRGILDAGGLRGTTILASSDIDEYELQRLERAGAPIDGFGVGTRVVTSADRPYLDCAYKLQAYAGRARCKLSAGKATWPGAKQVYRHGDDAGRMSFDVIALAGETHAGTPLLPCVMRAGRRLAPPPEMATIRSRVKEQLRSLPASLRSLERGEPFRVLQSQALQAEARRLGVWRPGRDDGAAPAVPAGYHHGFLGRLHDDAPGEVDADTATAQPNAAGRRVP